MQPPTLTRKHIITYNNNGFIDHLNGYLYDPVTQAYAATPYDHARYYYETYNDPTAVAAAEKISGKLGLYPNPGSETTTVEAKKGSQLRVFNLNGQKVYEATAAAAETQIRLADWAHGCYLVQAIAPDGTFRRNAL